jgi:hypothetical protein
LETGSDWDGPAARKLELQLYELRQDNNTGADTAVCLLLPYYLGESNGDDLQCNVLRRGDRVVGCLKALLKDGPVDFGSEFRQFRLPDATWRPQIEQILQDIEDHKPITCYE